MERIYPAYASKSERNAKLATENPRQLAKLVNEEYQKALKSKSKVYERLDKLPIRIYGSGDFIKEHLKIFPLLDFKFFVISKSLTYPDLRKYISKIVGIGNITTLLLSFDSENLKYYNSIVKLTKHPMIRRCFTGTPQEYKEVSKKYKFNVFFSISKKQVDKNLAKSFKEHCPVDAGRLKLQKACSYCNKCWH